MTHSRQKKFGSAVSASAAQQQMSLASRGQVGDGQPADPVPGGQSVQAGQQMGNFRHGFGSERGAAEMMGPLSRGQRPETTGSRGGSASGRESRDAGGCFAADCAILRPAGSHGSSELSRPGASAEEEADSIRSQAIRREWRVAEVPDNGVSVPRSAMLVGGNIRDARITGCTDKALIGLRGGDRSNSAHRTSTSDCAVIQGAGEIAFRPGGLMQDTVQLQVGQQVERQQMVLGGCGGEAAEEGCNGSSRNGGAAARAAAGERPIIIFPMSRGRERNRRERERMRDRMDRVGEIDEESGTESEEEDPNGGAAACAAAIDTGVWAETLREAGVRWEGSVQDFAESDAVGEEAARHWSEGAMSLRDKLRELEFESDCEGLAARGAAVMRAEFEQMDRRGGDARFARFVQDAMCGLEAESGQEAEDELGVLIERHNRLLSEAQEASDSVSQLQNWVNGQQEQGAVGGSSGGEGSCSGSDLEEEI